MPPPGHEPFLHAICANPEDDTARLVYADWLDENGDPDRAEHIRLTIAAAREPRLEGRADPRFARAQQLLTRHRAAWTAELPGPPTLWQDAVWWHAGFPAVVSVAWGEQPFLRHVDEIVWRTPARGLVLAALGDPVRTLTALGDCRALVHFRAAFTARTLLRDAGARALAGGPGFAGLRELVLPDTGITDAGALALARSPHLTGLTHLNLERNPIGAFAADVLRARFGDAVQLTPPG